MTTELEVAPARERRKKSRVLQGVGLAWLISIFAVALILSLSPKGTRGDRLFGAWIMVGLQAAGLSFYALSALAS